MWYLSQLKFYLKLANTYIFISSTIRKPIASKNFYDSHLTRQCHQIILKCKIIQINQKTLKEGMTWQDQRKVRIGLRMYQNH